MKNSTLRKTRTRLFLLNRLRDRDRLEFDRRYTLALRIMEEGGFVSRNSHRQWSITQKGRQALERWS